MQHLDEGTIHAWLDGALSQTESDDIAHHVAGCALCPEQVAAARGVIAGASRVVSSLDVIRGNVIPATQNAPRSLWRRLHLTPGRAALAASILVAASTMLAVRHDTPEKKVISPTTFDQAAPASVPQTVTAAPRMETVAATPRPHSRAHSAVSATPAAAAPAPIPNVAPPIAQQLDQVVTAQSAAKVAVARRALPDSAVSAAVAGVGGAAPRAMQLRAMSLVESSNMCYHVAPDSAQLVKNLPERFALQRDDAGRNVVRSVTPDGRIDSVLVGSDWHNRPPEVVVRFATPTPVTLSFTSNAARGQASSGAENRSVVVRRADCRP